MQSSDDKIIKLQHSLIHWQKWEAEYEAIRDEVKDLDDCTAEELFEIASELGGDLVTAKEIKELTISPTGNGRSVSQITDALNRRIEYTQRNVQTVERMLEGAKEQSKPASAESNLDEQDEYPLTEIREDLDEEGNILSSATFRPKDEKPQIIESLQKAGVLDLSSEDNVKQQNQANEEFQKNEMPVTTNLKSFSTTNSEAVEPRDKIERAKGVQKTSKKRKKVSFAAADNEKEQIPSSKTSQSLKSDVSDFTFKAGSKVLELNDKDKPIRATPVIPDDETPEELALRREMLEYSLNEVGNVVAELDLCEDEELSSLSDESASDIEDEYGRQLGGNITPEYRAQMQELQRKVNNSLESDRGKTIGISRTTDNKSDKSNGNPITPVPSEKINELAPKRPPTKAKKSLRFADKVEVHHLPNKSTKKPNKKRGKHYANLKSTETSLTPAQALKTGPVDTLSSTVIERQVKERPASENSDLDTATLLHEAKTNYYDIRNRAIQRQGGFMPTEEEEDNPLMEEHNGQVRKVSRFKAARLKPANAE